MKVCLFLSVSLHSLAVFGREQADHNDTFVEEEVEIKKMKEKQNDVQHDGDKSSRHVQNSGMQEHFLLVLKQLQHERHSVSHAAVG